VKKIHVKPLCENECGANLFQWAYSGAFHLLKHAGAANGITFHSWESAPTEEADCVWVHDLPKTRATLEYYRSKARKQTPFVLQIMESPAWSPHFFDSRNYSLFDYVITYQQNIPEGDPKYLSYRLPNDFHTFRCDHKPYAGRKCCVLVNANRVEGWLAFRQKGLSGLPGLKAFINGWHRPLRSYFFQTEGELYGWRRALAWKAAEGYPGALEVYGRGWNGERISWCPLINRRPFPNRISGGVSDKFELISNFKFTIAAENYRGNKGYISEKIFDPLIAGSVPVYLGDENILDAVPGEAFVDARNFSSHAELLDYLVRCPEREWQRMYEAGREYMAGEKVKEFSMEKFSADMLQMLKRVMGLK
jgi:hypothetical protein